MRIQEKDIWKRMFKKDHKNSVHRIIRFYEFIEKLCSNVRMNYSEKFTSLYKYNELKMLHEIAEYAGKEKDRLLLESGIFGFFLIERAIKKFLLEKQLGIEGRGKFRKDFIEYISTLNCNNTGQNGYINNIVDDNNIFCFYAKIGYLPNENEKERAFNYGVFEIREIYGKWKDWTDIESYVIAALRYTIEHMFSLFRKSCKKDQIERFLYRHKNANCKKVNIYRAFDNKNTNARRKIREGIKAVVRCSLYEKPLIVSWYDVLWGYSESIRYREWEIDDEIINPEKFNKNLKNFIRKFINDLFDILDKRKELSGGNLDEKTKYGK